MSVFWPRQIERLLQNLGLHRFAAEQSFEIAHPLLEVTDTARAHDVLVGLDCGLPALQHTALPAKQLGGCHAGLTGHQGDRRARLHCLFDKPKLFGRRPTPPALHRRNHLNTGARAIRGRCHSRTHRRMPMPYRAMPDCPVQTGCSSEGYENGVTLDFSRPGKPTDNAFIESFNGRLRDECLNAHWFLSLADAKRIRCGGGPEGRRMNAGYSL